MTIGRLDLWTPHPAGGCGGGEATIAELQS
jgi:hypothetical protein